MADSTLTVKVNDDDTLELSADGQALTLTHDMADALHRILTAHLF